MKQCVKIVLLLCFALCPAIAFSQSNDAAEEAPGLTLILDLRADAFRFFNRTFDSPDIRPKDSQNSSSVQFPISNKDFWTDSKLTLSYDGRVYGGHFTLDQAALETKTFGKMGGWVRLGLFRVTLGNDIGSTYADPLGADPGMRLYTGSKLKSTRRREGAVFSYENADNITGYDGVLVEAFLNSFTIGLAAGDFEFNLAETLGNLPGTNTYGRTVDQKFRYGARVGYEHENNWKLNASYVFSGQTNANMYGYKYGSDEVVPTKPNAQSSEHKFGLYGSIYLPSGLDLTLGYAGHISSVLKEFYGNAREMVETGTPLVFMNGLNLNARYKLGDLRLRTDNSFSFWKDKDFTDVFEIQNSVFDNKGYLAKAQADRFAEIDHFIMWNGFGASYPVTGNVSADLYLRNLLAVYSASGNMPVGSGEYNLLRDEIGLELKFTYRIHANAEAYIKLVAQDSVLSRSRDLNSQSRGIFIDYINNNISLGMKPSPIATLDNEFTVFIPIGLVLKF